MRTFALVTFGILLLALIGDPLIDRWNAKPEVYYFFTGAPLICLLVFWQKLQHGDMEINRIDILLFVCYTGVFTIALFDHPLTPFYLRDDLLSLTAVLCLYVPFKNLSKWRTDSLPHMIAWLALTELIWGLCQLIMALFHHKAVFGHLTGTFRNSGVYAIFLCCCLPSILSLLRNETLIPVVKKLYKGIGCAIAAIVLINGSRTGLLLILAIVVFQYRSSLRSWLTRFGKNALLLRIFLCCISIAGLAILIYIKYPSVTGRLFIWRTALGMWIEKPFWGWGIAGFEKYYMLHQAAYFQTHPVANPGFIQTALNTVTAFNEYIMIAVRFGIAGLFVFGYAAYRGLIAGKVNRSGIRNYDALTLLLIAGSAMFYYSFHITLILVLAVASLAKIAVLIPPSSDDKYFHWISQSYFKKVFFALSILFLVFVIGYCSWQSQATFRWKEAGSKSAQNDQYATRLFEQAYPALRHRSNFLFNYGALAFQAGHYQRCIEILEECRSLQPGVDLLLYLGKAYQLSGNHTKAEEEFTTAAYMAPSLFTPKYYLVQLYLQDGAKEKSLSLAREILSMPVKIPSAEIDRIKAEMASLLTLPDDSK